MPFSPISIDSSNRYIHATNHPKAFSSFSSALIGPHRFKKNLAGEDGEDQ
jgi:hypothetical protein